MRRGDVYDTRFDPAEGSEAAGGRPAIIVSRDPFNSTSPVVVVVPCTSYREGRRLYPSHVVLRAGLGGLTVDSLVQAEQIRVVSKSRLLRQRGSLAATPMTAVSTALRIALDLG